MTFKICPNCNKNIASFNEECPLCHADLRNVSVEPRPEITSVMREGNQQNSDNQSSVIVRPARKRKKPIIIGICVAVAIAVIAIFTVQFISNNNLSVEGEQALRYVKRIKNIFKSPNSLKFYQDILYLEYNDSATEEHYDLYYFDYTAANSYGAEVRYQLAYINGDPYDLNEEKPELDDYRSYNGDISDQKYDEFLEARAEYRRTISPANRALAYYKIAGDNEPIFRSEVIPAQKKTAKL